MKRTITEKLEHDWVVAFSDCTKEEAITYLQGLPDGAYLDMNWHGYDGGDGRVFIEREETDEEYASRLEYEQEVADKALAKALKKKADDQKNIDDTIAKLKQQVKQLERARPK